MEPKQIGPLDRDAAGRVIERLAQAGAPWARPLVIVYGLPDDRALLVIANTAGSAHVEIALMELGARPCPPAPEYLLGGRRLRGGALTAYLAGDPPVEEEREYAV